MLREDQLVASMKMTYMVASASRLSTNDVASSAWTMCARGAWLPFLRGAVYKEFGWRVLAGFINGRAFSCTVASILNVKTRIKKRRKTAVRLDVYCATLRVPQRRPAPQSNVAWCHGQSRKGSMYNGGGLSSGSCQLLARSHGVLVRST